MMVMITRDVDTYCCDVSRPRSRGGDGRAVVVVAVAGGFPSGDGAPSPCGASSSAESAQTLDSLQVGTPEPVGLTCNARRTRCIVFLDLEDPCATVAFSPKRSACTYALPWATMPATRTRISLR